MKSILTQITIMLSKIFNMQNIFWTAVISFFSPQFWILTAAMYMIFLDLMCALLVIKMKKETFVSGKAWRTPGKMGLVFFVFTGLRMLDIGLSEHFTTELPTLFQLSVWFCAFVCIAELKSIDETFTKYMGYSFYAIISDKLSFITKYIKQKKQ